MKTASEKLTPLMQQYRDIKSRHRDAILFFRMGDFYEMFYDDARLAARELGLTLTTRNNGAAARVPLAGVPVKAAVDYLRRLVEAGHRVAICEQVEDPKEARGVVRREVVETITPGAVLDDEWLDGKRNNFLVAILPGEVTGLAALDLSTGEFMLETAAADEIEPLLRRYEAREVILPEGADLGLPAGLMVTPRESWEFAVDIGEEEICRTFAVAGLEGFGVESDDRPGVAAAGALLRYASELRPSGLPQIARPQVRRSGGVVLLDEMTRRNLELIDTLRPSDDGLTLLRVLDRTVTPMGGRLLRRWLVAPLNRSGPIVERLDAVEQLLNNQRGRLRLRESLDGVRDLERLGGRAAAHRAGPRDLGALRDSLRGVARLMAVLQEDHADTASTRLRRIATELDPLDDLADGLDAMLVESPPAVAGSGDAIRAGADPEMDEARELRDGGKDFIAGIQARERERTGIGSLKVGYNKVFGYYIEVTRANRDLVPDDYDRRQTLTNAERYITPELKEYEARVLGAEERVEARERELVDELCDRVATRLERLQRTARLVAELDVYLSLAEVAERERYVRPEITDHFELELSQCRHPVVEKMLPPGRFIPNDVRLDDSSRLMLLTGPNMAGKSTVLRQVGLAVAMAQMGSFVPADGARIGVVDRIFTRVGASDNLVRGQSTFMVEMSETSAILHGATRDSLILLDEIGRGTSTYDGVAIAWAVSEDLHDRIGAKTIFATHYHELTQLTETLQHAVNFNVAVRESENDIVFLHRLVAGAADRSYGIHVGQLAGLPPDVVQRAWEILRSLESQHHVAHDAPPPPPDARQLALFEQESALLEDIRRMNPDAMTPIEALNRLAELKKMVEEK